MQLDRWQRQLLCNVRVLQFARLVDGLALDPFGGQTTGSDCRATAERLELGIDNLPVRIHFYLQFHYIATGGSTDQSSAHCDVLLVQGAHVARVLVVVDDLSEEEFRKESATQFEFSSGSRFSTTHLPWRGRTLRERSVCGLSASA